MRKIEMNNSAFFLEKAQQKFILLGDDHLFTENNKNSIESRVFDKLHRFENISGLWATLGHANDAPIKWKGKLNVSTDGSEGFSVAVDKEIEKLALVYPELKDKSLVKAHSVSFDEIDFDYPNRFTLDEFPELRLDVMLERNEGALVFYEGLNQEDAEDVFYIHPQPTDKNNTNKRNRLRYQFRIIPKNDIEEDANIPGLFHFTGIENGLPFLIKVLIFKRELKDDQGNVLKDSHEMIRYTERKLQLFNRKCERKDVHKLLIFNLRKNDFDEVKHGDIDPNAKTLFLMHGTFSCTNGSFDALYGHRKRVFLKDLINDHVYEQILAFDHPTVSDGAKENVEYLFEYLHFLGIQYFSEKVDFIGTSQGGLLVQYIAGLGDGPITVGKAALVASANGVGYFTASEGIEVFLKLTGKLLSLIGMGEFGMLAHLAQHSIDAFTNQPGMAIMTPGNDALNKIINADYVAASDGGPLFYPVVGDYTRDSLSVLAPIPRFLLRIAIGKKDALPQLILGEYNDLVVGTREQFLVQNANSAIPHYSPDQYRQYKVDAVHGSLLKHEDVCTNLRAFFMHGKEGVAYKGPAEARYDGHCHLLGRNIITARILTLLIRDLIPALKDKEGDLTPEDLEPIFSAQPIFSVANDCSDQDEGEGKVFKNVFRYALMNKTAARVLDDLSEEYLKLNSDIYRYIPLMFDLEMTFREKYEEESGQAFMDHLFGKSFALLSKLYKALKALIDLFEDNGANGLPAFIQNAEETITRAKSLRSTLDQLLADKPDLHKDTKTAYNNQLHDLNVLKKRYGDYIHPFLAVDPRRMNGDYIKENVGPGKTFKGIKLYAPNGYSPLDIRLFRQGENFVDGRCLYQYCQDEDIPIMAHCSDAGFATFVEDLEVRGEVNTEEQPADPYALRWIHFKHKLPFGDVKFDEAVRERAYVLNHPKLWAKVMKAYPDLRICLAHFGGESSEWRKDIAELMLTRKEDGSNELAYPKLFTDLSCVLKACRLKEIKDEYFDNKELTDRIMYGSDFYLNMFNDITFSNYYTHFEEVFGDGDAMRKMTVEVPERYLNI